MSRLFRTLVCAIALMPCAGVASAQTAEKRPQRAPDTDQTVNVTRGTRLVTYTLPEEGGASLRGAGWRCIGEAGGGSWSRTARPRVDAHPTQRKLRWEAA